MTSRAHLHPLASAAQPSRTLAFASSLLLGVATLVGPQAFAQDTPVAPAVTQGVTSGVPTGSGTQAPAQPSTAAAPGLAAPNAAMLYPGDDFQLGPGDLVNVRVFGSYDYVNTVRIDRNGNVELPYIGSVHLDRLNVHEAQLLIADRLRTGGFYIDPEVIIQVADSINSSVTVTGEVRQVVPVTGARPLLGVLAAAGGLPANASHTVRIVRPGRAEPIVVNLGTDLTSSEGANILVYPRDIIQVSRAGVVFVLGAFKNQGSLPLDQSMPLTLMQVAALSGGVGYEGRYEDLRLVRTFGNERRVVQVDIKKVLYGKAPDPILQANDIVFLPTNNMKAALKSLGIGGVVGMVSLLVSLHNY